MLPVLLWGGFSLKICYLSHLKIPVAITPLPMTAGFQPFHQVLWWRFCKAIGIWNLAHTPYSHWSCAVSNKYFLSNIQPSYPSRKQKTWSFGKYFVCFSLVSSGSRAWDGVSRQVICLRDDLGSGNEEGRETGRHSSSIGWRSLPRVLAGRTSKFCWHFRKPWNVMHGFRLCFFEVQQGDSEFACHCPPTVRLKMKWRKWHLTCYNLACCTLHIVF